MIENWNFRSCALQQCWLWAEWPDLAKFHHFGNILKVFGNFWGVLEYFVKLRTIMLANVLGYWANFHYQNGQILKRYSSDLVTLVASHPCFPVSGKDRTYTFFDLTSSFLSSANGQAVLVIILPQDVFFILWNCPICSEVIILWSI